MAEDFTTAELVVPGTYIRVRADALIGAGGISTGNIGIVGSAKTVDPNQDTAILSQYTGDGGGLAVFGPYDALATGKDNLTRGLEVLFRNGALTVYARAVPEGGTTAQFTAAFEEVIKEDVNILVVPELSTADAFTVLGPLLLEGEQSGRDMIAVIGSDAAKVTDIVKQVKANPRIILVAPGIAATETVWAADLQTVASTADVTLPGTYSGAAVAGLLSTLAPQSSPTNKTLPAVAALADKFSYSEIKALISGGVLVLEERLGVRIVRGVSTDMADTGPFSQITTRRIVDFAKAGIRQVSDAFIGRLNNGRVRKALQGAIDGFLTSMLVDEALTSYQLQVTATRDDEIANRAIVNVLLQPTFSIDFVAVTLVLQ